MKNKIILIVTLFVLFGVAYYLTNSSKKDAVPEPEVQEEILPQDPDRITDQELLIFDETNPKSVVNEFMNNFLNSRESEEALNKAVDLLHQDAVSEMRETPVSGDLALMIGVQDMPDMGFEIMDMFYSDDVELGITNGIADVMVELKFSGGNVLRQFSLTKVEEAWLIKSVKAL